MREKKTQETNKPKQTLIENLKFQKTHIRNISFSSLMKNRERKQKTHYL